MEGVNTKEAFDAIDGLGPGDAPEEIAPYDHPWLKHIQLPEGLITPQQDTVAARPLALVRKGRIILPETKKKSAGWFIIGFPGNQEDLDATLSQELVIKTADSAGNERELVLGPGDLVAASDFQCWPVDIVDTEGISVFDRWRRVVAADVVMHIKQGTELYKAFMEQYQAFRTEQDPDISV